MTDFDARAKDWDFDPMKVDRARAVADAIRAAVDIRPSMVALEYGCGTGLLSFFLQEEFASITLADTSKGMLEVLSDKIKAAKTAHMRPVRLDLAVDPLPAQKFDVTYSLMVLHHIPDPDLILRKFHQLLKPGGWLVVADLDEEDGSFHTDGSTDVHLGFARDDLQKRTEAAGFSQVRFSNAYEINKTIDDEQRTFPVFLMTARRLP
jgi:ubiquinone/menaquinone biosynthesis C-methylase UbiE